MLPIYRDEGRLSGKSLTNTANIPVFGRVRLETGFDYALRCRVCSPIHPAFRDPRWHSEKTNASPAQLRF